MTAAANCTENQDGEDVGSQPDQPRQAAPRSHAARLPGPGSIES